MPPFQLPFQPPGGKTPLQQLEDEYSIPLDERGGIDYEKLHENILGPVVDPNQAQAPEQPVQPVQQGQQPQQPQQPQQQPVPPQETPEIKEAIKRELALRAVKKYIEAGDYSISPRAIADGKTEVLPDMNADQGMWNRIIGTKPQVANKGEYGGSLWRGYADWMNSVRGEADGFEATKTRDEGDVVTDVDINEMLKQISNDNYAVFGNDYTIDPHYFKSQFKAHAMAKAVLAKQKKGGMLAGTEEKNNFGVMFRAMEPEQQAMFTNALDSMMEDGGHDQGAVNRFIGSFSSGMEMVTGIGDGVSTLLGSKTDEQLEAEAIEEESKALIDSKTTEAGFVGKQLNTVAQIAPAIVASGLIAAAAAPVAAGLGATAGVAAGTGKVAAGAFWFDQVVGPTKDRMRRAGMTNSEANMLAVPAAAAIAAMEYLQVKRLTRFGGSGKNVLDAAIKQTGSFKEKLLQSAVTNSIKKIATQGVKEAGQESLQQVVEEGAMFLGSKMHDSEFDLGESFDNVKNAFTDTVFAMAIVGAPGSVSRAISEKKGVESLRARMAIMDSTISVKIDELVRDVHGATDPNDFDELLDWASNPARAQEDLPGVLRSAAEDQAGVLNAPLESVIEFMGDRFKTSVMESIERNKDELLEGREDAQGHVDSALEAALGTEGERAHSRVVAGIFIDHLENNPELADKMAELISNGNMSRKAFKDLLLASGDTFKKDGSVNPETPSGKLMLSLLENISSTGGDAQVSQEVNPAELMNLSAAEFNAWVEKETGMAGQHVPEFSGIDEALEEQLDDSFAPGISAAQERARLINEIMPGVKFVLPTSLLRLGNQNARQRKVFSSVMQGHLRMWMEARDESALSPSQIKLKKLEEQLAREIQAGDTEGAGNTRLRIVGHNQAIAQAEAAQAPEAAPPVQAGAAVEAPVVEAQEAPLSDAGVERIANTIGDMFGEQGLIENEDKVFELIETALNGEIESKIGAQQELLTIMEELSNGKELSYEEHEWEDVPDKAAKEMGDTFARLVDMGYLQNLGEVSPRDVEALGLDPDATLAAAVEINERIHSDEKVSREQMNNIIYEKHTGQELQVQRVDPNRMAMDMVALNAVQNVTLAGKKGRKLEPTVTVPRSQITPGEFVFSEPGKSGIGQIGKMLGPEPTEEAVAEPKRGDPVATAEQAGPNPKDLDLKSRETFTDIFDFKDIKKLRDALFAFETQEWDDAKLNVPAVENLTGELEAYIREYGKDEEVFLEDYFDEVDFLDELTLSLDSARDPSSENHEQAKRLINVLQPFVKGSLTGEPNARAWKKDFFDAYMSEDVAPVEQAGVIKDPDGRPKIFLHGTIAEFDEFDLSKTSSSSGSPDTLVGDVAFFSDDGSTASYVAASMTGKTEKVKLMERHLRMENPLEYSGGENIDTQKMADLIKEAQAAGNDGVIYKSTGMGNTYVVFNSDQIMKTTGESYRQRYLEPSDKIRKMVDDLNDIPGEEGQRLRSNISDIIDDKYSADDSVFQVDSTGRPLENPLSPEDVDLEFIAENMGLGAFYEILEQAKAKTETELSEKLAAAAADLKVIESIEGPLSFEDMRRLVKQGKIPRIKNMPLSELPDVDDLKPALKEFLEKEIADATSTKAAPQEGSPKISKPKPLFKSSSPSFDIELQQTAVDAFGDEAGAYINALKDLTDDQDIAQAITSLAVKNIGESVDETIQNAISNMEDLGIRTKEVDGRKVIDDAPITIKEASEPITPQTGPVASEVEGVSWWGSLTEAEREDHLREGEALLKIQLKQAGLGGADFSYYSLGMLTASRDDKFAGGVIGQIVPFTGISPGPMGEVASIEFYFTPGAGKDFGAFFADVIMKKDLSKEGYKFAPFRLG